MSEYQILAVIAAFAFLYSLVASRLERTPINGALVYVVCGLICGPTLLDLIKMNVQEEGIKLLAELTLAVVLFSDSANANLRVLRRVEQLPIRLLLIGLPLTIALGFGVGYLLFDGMSLFAIALLATMLAPTDAALGKAVVTNEAVPDSIRTEAGLRRSHVHCLYGFGQRSGNRPRGSAPRRSRCNVVFPRRQRQPGVS